MLDIATPFVERVHLNGIDIESQNVDAGAPELNRQWKADLAKAHNRDMRHTGLSALRHEHCGRWARVKDWQPHYRCARRFTVLDCLLNSGSEETNQPFFFASS